MEFHDEGVESLRAAKTKFRSCANNNKPWDVVVGLKLSQNAVLVGKDW